MLDIAGGTGDVTFMACERKQPAHIILSDYTPAMLDVAQTRLDAGEANGVPIVLAVVDGQNIPFDDDVFDIVTMSYGIRNMPEREKALSEMYRVLRPGGALCVLEVSTTKPSYAPWLRCLLALGYSRLGQNCHRRRFRICVLSKFH